MNDMVKPPAVSTDESHDIAIIKTNSATAEYLGVAAILICYLLFYASALPELAYDWFNYYGPFSYCALIPLLSLYVVWKEREDLRSTPAQPALVGFLFLCIAVGLGLLGKAIVDSFIV